MKELSLCKESETNSLNHIKASEAALYALQEHFKIETQANLDMRSKVDLLTEEVDITPESHDLVLE